MAMVLNKEGSWRMCPDFFTLNKLTIKEKFPIHVIDDLLDEAQLFTKLDLCFGYHQIRIKEANIPKTTFQTHVGVRKTEYTERGGEQCMALFTKTSSSQNS
jgi:hypothetical protein